jgi:rubrerythrin
VSVKPKNWTAVDSYVDQFKARNEKRVLSKIESVLATEYAHSQSKRDKAHLHPSSLAKNDWCPRANYFQLTGEQESNPGSFNLRRLNTFQAGHDIHDKWQRWMAQTGCLVGNWRCVSCAYGWMAKSPDTCPECGSDKLKYREVPIYDDEHRILGHSDGMWEDHLGRALIEIKSVGLGTIRWDAPDLYRGYEEGTLKLDDLWARIKRPLLPHRRQINLYMYCAKVDKAIVIYEWKPTQEVKEFHLTLDMSLVQPMLDGAKAVLSALDTQQVPDRPQEARKSGMCKFCEYKDRCWT